MGPIQWEATAGPIAVPHQAKVQPILQMDIFKQCDHLYNGDVGVLTHLVVDDGSLVNLVCG